MSAVLGIISSILLAIVGVGAYRVWLWLVHHQMQARVAFVLITMVGAAMLTPFLLPDNGWLQVAVWGLYMLFAGIGASHIWETLKALRNIDIPS